MQKLNIKYKKNSFKDKCDKCGKFGYLKGVGNKCLCATCIEDISPIKTIKSKEQLITQLTIFDL